MKYLLFDLDGTLLPMQQDAFYQLYMTELIAFMKKKGLEFDTKTFLHAMNDGRAAMANNDGSQINEDAFWATFCPMTGLSREIAAPYFLEFYANDFNKVQAAAIPHPLVGDVIRVAKEKGLRLFLATSPLFPPEATHNRVRWAGLQPDDFEEITTFEHYHYSKPNPLFYQELMERFHLEAQECLMVGNDFIDDMAIKELGVPVYIISDYMERVPEDPSVADYIGSMEEFLAFLKAL